MSSEEVSFTFQLTVDEAVTELRRIQTVAYQYLALARRLGLPDEIDAQVVKVQRLIMLLNSARLAAIALHAASGPVGWALAGVGLVATGLTAYEMAEYELRG